MNVSKYTHMMRCDAIISIAKAFFNFIIMCKQSLVSKREYYIPVECLQAHGKFVV